MARANRIVIYLNLGAMELALLLSVQLLTYQPLFSTRIAQAPVMLLTLVQSALVLLTLAWLPSRCLPLALSALVLSAPFAHSSLAILAPLSDISKCHVCVLFHI